MKKGNHQDKGKSHADANSYELPSRSTSPPPTTPPVASLSSHQDNDLNQQSSLGFRLSLFSAYLGRVASQFKQRTIKDIEKGCSDRDKGKSCADPPVPASPQQGTSSLRHTKDKGKCRATDSVSQIISSSDTPDQTSSLVIRSTSPPPITPGQPIASSSSHKLEDIPTQNTQPPVETFNDYASQLMNGIQTIRTTRWRVINTYFLLIAGTAMSISAYKNASAPANSLDLAIGIVWALISYWFSIFETENPNIMPWLFKPAELHTLQAVAPVLVPCTLYLSTFLMMKGVVSLFYEPLKRLLPQDRDFFPVFGLILYTATVTVFAGFIFLQILGSKLNLKILYSKLRIHKLIFIIKLVFQSGDWEITGWKSMLSLVLLNFILSMLFVPLFRTLSDLNLNDMDDIPLFFAAVMTLPVFPAYFIVGVGHMVIRLVKYNRLI